MRNTFYRPRGKGEEFMAYLPYLRAWRRAVGLTRDGLAGMANVHPATISRIENHPFEHPCHLGLVHRLAEVLGIPNHHLITHEPPEELPATWALGRVIRVTEDGGELRFTLPHLSGYLNEDPEPGDTFWSVAQIPLAELARRSGIALEDLEALRRCEIGATMAQLQRIGAALGQSLMRLIS
jgi:transcriptional regulator with XRE-family HTH domain